MSSIRVWPSLLDFCAMIPTDQICHLFEEIFNAVADCKVVQGEAAEQIFQSDLMAKLWEGVLQQFGKTTQIKSLARNVFDKVQLALPVSGPHSGFRTTYKLLWALMQTNSSIFRIAMQNLDHMERKRLWNNAAAAADDEELLNTLTVVVFQ
jgi:hypothetical protein